MDSISILFSECQLQTLTESNNQNSKKVYLNVPEPH